MYRARYKDFWFQVPGGPEAWISPLVNRTSGGGAHGVSELLLECCWVGLGSINPGADVCSVVYEAVLRPCTGLDDGIKVHGAPRGLFWLNMGGVGSQSLRLRNLGIHIWCPDTLGGRSGTQIVLGLAHANWWMKLV